MSHKNPSVQLPSGLGESAAQSDVPPRVDDAIEIRNLIDAMLSRLKTASAITASVSSESGPNDNGTVRGMKSGEELPIADDKITKDAKFLVKSLEVKILHFFNMLNSSTSKDSEISRLSGVLLSSNRYVVSKMEQEDETTWVELVVNHKQAALSINNNKLAALFEAFYALKKSEYAQDIKKNFLYLWSKTVVGTRTKMYVECQYYSDLVSWFESTLAKKRSVT